MAMNRLYEEDEVCIKTSSGYKCGLVVESSEYISSDEEDEDYDDLLVKRGTCRVSWHPDGKEQILEENKVTLLDRSLMPGDVVRRFIEGQDSQRGYVRKTNLMCHLQILGSNKVIHSVPGSQLLPIVYWDPDPGFVVYDCWIGKIESVNESYTLGFSDDARCVTNDQDEAIECFNDVFDKRDKDSEYDGYYPGQTLIGALGELQDATWLKTSKLHSREMAMKHPTKQVTVTILKCDVACVDVHWLCRGYTVSDNTSSKGVHPPRTVKVDVHQKMSKLDCFEESSLELGEKCIYVLKETDTVQTIRSVNKKPLVHYLLIKEENQERLQMVDDLNSVNSVQGAPKSSVILESDHDNVNLEVEDAEDYKTGEDVGHRVVKETGDDHENEADEMNEYESDSSDEPTNASNTSTPRKKPRKGLAIKLVKKKKGVHSKKKKIEKNYKPGDQIPVEIIHTTTFIEVMWQDGTVESNIKSTELLPIHHLDDSEFFPGDYVVPSAGASGSEYGVVESVDHSGRTCMIRWIKPYQVGKSDRPDMQLTSEEVSVYDIADHQDYKFRPGLVAIRISSSEGGGNQPAGQVYELMTDGRLHIMWSDGTLSFAYPQEVFLLNDEEISEITASEMDSSDGSDGSWETEGEDTEDAESESNDFRASIDKEIVLKVRQTVETAHLALRKIQEVGTLFPEIGPKITMACKQFSKVYMEYEKLDFSLFTEFLDSQREQKETNSRRKKEKVSDVMKHVTGLLETITGCLGQVVSPVDKVSDTIGAASLPEAGQMPKDNKDNETTLETSLHELNEMLKNCKIPATADSKAKRIIEARLANTVFDLSEIQNIVDDSYNACVIEKQTISDSQEESLSNNANFAVDSDTARPPGDSPLSQKELCLRACRLLIQMMLHFFMNFYQLLKEYEPVKLTDGEPSSTEEPQDEGSKENLEAVVTTGDVEGPDSAKNTEESQENPESQNEVPKQIVIPKLDLVSASAVDHVVQSVWSPVSPMLDERIQFNKDGFAVLEAAPSSHKFFQSAYVPVDQKAFMTAVRKELKLLKTSLPFGIYVKGFEDRMDLFSVMIEGPARTPYEDGLFFFEVQLPQSYPVAPPLVHYIAYCLDRLNPNLYDDGKVCVSLLGTWSGRGTEVWTSSSNMLQVLISIQGLILNGEPYYNEAGYERQKGTQEGWENSRMYNEMAVLKLIQSTIKMVTNPPTVFAAEVVAHLQKKAFPFIRRLEMWLKISETSVRDLSMGTKNVPNQSELPAKASSQSDCHAVSSSKSDNETLSNSQSESHTVSTSQSEPSLPTSHNSAPSGVSFVNQSKSDSCEGIPLSKPDFPLLPASKGFCLSLRKLIVQFKAVLETTGIRDQV